MFQYMGSLFTIHEPQKINQELSLFAGYGYTNHYHYKRYQTRTSFLGHAPPLQSSINSGSNRYNYSIDELKQIPNWQNLSEGEIKMHFSMMGAQKQAPLSDLLDTSAQDEAGMSRENLHLSRE